MKVLYSVLPLAAFAMTSCKGELEPQESSVVTETTDATTTNPAMTTTTQPIAVAPVQGATQQTLAQGVNPAHGQPGHQCDVAVAAPLTKNTTSPTSRTMTQQVTPQMLNAAPPAQQPVKTAPGMNPPHGQAGHRCDVAVGASLSSAPKPAAANANPVTMTPATVNSNGTITPGSGTTITTTNNNSSTPAMLKAPTEGATSTNPPHGQPGHVCAQ